ncbi:MAG: FAD-binding oxidoreductase, partial [Candidatus ainarchaeum sp.]|nr:FAD-binding oxidoreductase [Candidatus ainarchaeum sp.]
MNELESPMKPDLAEITRVKEETPSLKTFTVKYLGKKKLFNFVPGKFMMVSVFGFGEMPISISSSPYKKASIELTVNAVGNTSKRMHSLAKGDLIGLRGPF